MSRRRKSAAFLFLGVNANNLILIAWGVAANERRPRIARPRNLKQLQTFRRATLGGEVAAALSGSNVRTLAQAKACGFFRFLAQTLNNLILIA